MRQRSRRQRARSAPGDARPGGGRRTRTAQAAGVDCGAHARVAGGPAGADQQRGRPCGTDPAARQTRADGGGDRGIPTGARASTGVSGMPLCEARAAPGFHCCLRSAPAMQRVPGRQRAGLDWPWLQPLPRSGFWSAACRPDAAGVALRTLGRQRAQRRAPRAPQVLHMPQALVQMPLPWSHALSAGTGPTGLQLLRASVAGERAPHPLAAWRHDRGTQEAEALALARTGPWRAAHLCVRPQARALCDCDTVQSSACDAQLAGAVAVLTPHCAPAAEAPGPPCAPTPPRRTPHAHRQQAPAVTTRAPLLRMPGVDRGAGPGSSAAMAQPMLSALGTDRRTWPEDQHGGSWLGLAPPQASAGGTGRKSRTRQQRNRAAHACRLAAPAVLRSHGAVGALSRRLQGRLGPAQALVATAHKSARTVSQRLPHRLPSYDIGAAE